MLKNLKENHLVNSVLQSDIGIFQIRRRLVNLYKIVNRKAKHSRTQSQVTCTGNFEHRTSRAVKQC